MHLALRRHAEPPRDIFQYFCLGAVFTVIALAAIFERLDEIENQELIADFHHQQIAKAAATVHAYAYEAFPAWAVDHPDADCPVDRAALDVYLGGATGLDPWGRPYSVRCDGPGRLVAWSMGPDASNGTADDVSNR